MLGFAALRAVLLMDASSVFEWLCCVCHKHALALAHASGGGKCKRRGSLPGMQWRAPQAVCTSAARKIRVPLVARQRQSLSAGSSSLPARSAWMFSFSEVQILGVKRESGAVKRRLRKVCNVITTPKAKPEAATRRREREPASAIWLQIWWSSSGGLKNPAST
jgi:hypothetical protein